MTDLFDFLQQITSLKSYPISLEKSPIFMRILFLVSIGKSLGQKVKKLCI